MKFYDDDTLGDMIEDEFGVPPEAMEEIYGFSNPYDDGNFGYCESEAKYREIEEASQRELDQMYFDEVVGKILQVIRDAYGVYPPIGMLRTIEDVVSKMQKSGHRLSRKPLSVTDTEPDEPEQLMKTTDVPVTEDDDNDVPF